MPKSQVRKRPDVLLYTCCQEVIANADPTNIDFIDMEYDVNKMLAAEIMLGPSTLDEDKKEIERFLAKKLPHFSGEITRSKVYIRR